MIVKLDHSITGLDKKKKDRRKKLEENIKFKDKFQQMYRL